MSRYAIAILIALSLLAFVNGGVVHAAPVGDCPNGFTLHQMSEHHHPGEGGDHAHKHVGNDKDLNGDGYICGKHVGKDGNVHVHVDNNVPWDTE